MRKANGAWLARARWGIAAIACGGLVAAAVAIAQQEGNSSEEGNSEQHVADQPFVSSDVVRTPVATSTPKTETSAAPTQERTPPDDAASSATPGPTTPTPPSRLESLNSGPDSPGWRSIEEPGFPLAAQAPPDYFARFVVLNLLNGTTAYQLHLTNFDPRDDADSPEGTPPPAGRVGVIAELYPTGPFIIGKTKTRELDRAAVHSKAASEPLEVVDGEFESQYWGVLRLIRVLDQLALADGRYLFVSAELTSPESDELVRQLLGIVSSLEVR
jgi:hypothetical protein